MTPKLGCILPQNSTNFDHLVEAAQTCEKLGYDSIWVFDHLAPYWTPSRVSLECWTTLAALAGHTREIRIGSMVVNVNLRHPSLLAKMVSSLDIISRGRIILGLGTGDKLSKDELTSYGYAFEDLNERIARLRETIQILKGMWTVDDFSFDGKQFKLSHAQLQPKPLQQPHPPIWVGGKHFRILDVVAELADGWNYWNLASNRLKDKMHYLMEKCSQNNRQFDSIIKSWSGAISPDQTTETLIAFLKERTDPWTEYFITYFGPRAEKETYASFADAIHKL